VVHGDDWIDQIGTVKLTTWAVGVG
jgi:hypothetical protein